MDTDLFAPAYRSAPHDNAIRNARAMALQAMRLAARADEHHSGGYIALATEWLALADEMESFDQDSLEKYHE